MTSAQSRLFLLLRWCVVCLFLGQGISILFGSNSYHLISKFSKEIQIISAFGLLFLGVVSSFSIKTLRKTKIYFLFPFATIILLVASYSKFIKVGHLPEQIIEHSLQFFLPIFWFFTIQKTDRIDQKNWILILKIILALTFIGHGIFAIGWHKVPYNFIEMTSASLFLDESQAISFLFVMGIVDFIVAILLFFPNRLIQKVAVSYMICWGLITAFARMYWQIDQIGTQFFWLDNVPNTVFRLPNGLIPLFLWGILFKTNVNSFVKK